MPASRRPPGSNSYFWEFNDPNPWARELTMTGGGNNAVGAYHFFR